jgi:DNA-binding beta-propeller fold protein YncE
MQYINWNIPDNTIVHVKNNILMDGYGGTINIGNNSELFIDDNVTLTLRNVIVKNNKNFAGNPAIKLSSNRSQLVLDNATLEMASDFYFNHGQMFVYNDVKFTGASAFVYMSPMTSFIESGARLYFDKNTTFSVTPATFTDCPYTYQTTYTASNFIRMVDATSTIIFDGSSFFTTPTGLRLTTGTVLFDNRVSLQSNASSDLASTNTSPVTYISGAGTGNKPVSVSWSPDGRFLAVVNNWGNSLQIFSFNGSGAPISIGTTSTGSASTPVSVSWSPDGRFLAVANFGGSTLQVFGFNGSGTLTKVTSGSGVATGTNPYSVSWSPDGRFLAVTNSGSSTLQVFSFTGSGNPTQITSGTGVATGTNPYSVSWSSNGRFIAVANHGSNTIQVFGVNYIVSQTPQALSNSIVFGNSALGSNYDATVDFLSGSNVILNGQLNVDNVN